jgi:ParB-like chromosome segregation protein Spo0J
MQIVIRDIDQIHPYPENPREIPESAVADLARLIEQRGFRDPIELNSAGVILAGHTRFLAAKRLGLTQVPTITHTDLSPEEETAYRIESNKAGEATDWSKSLLADQLSSLEGIIDAHEMGFDDKELDKLFDLTDVGAEPEPKPAIAAVCQTGDIWDLGTHQLIVGSGHESQCDEIIKHWQRKSKGKAKLGDEVFKQVEDRRKTAL